MELTITRKHSLYALLHEAASKAAAKRALVEEIIDEFNEDMGYPMSWLPSDEDRDRHTADTGRILALKLEIHELENLAGAKLALGEHDTVLVTVPKDADKVLWGPVIAEARRISDEARKVKQARQWHDLAALGARARFVDRRAA